MSENTHCTSCKLVSIGCLFGIGAYFLKLGFINKPKYVYNAIAIASFGLGVGNIFDYSPFRSNESQSE